MIVHHSPCFYLFILHNNSYDNQGSEINKKDIFYLTTYSLVRKLSSCSFHKRQGFLLGFSLTDTNNSQDSRAREGTFFYSNLPLPPAHEHSDIHFQLCT